MEIANTSQYPISLQKTFIFSINHLNCTQNRINSYIECKLYKIRMEKIKEELRINKWRFQSDYAIFKVIHFSYDSMNSEYAISKIVYQVPYLSFYKLSTSLTLSNCLYCLMTILMTCQKLVEEFGYFQLTEKMIGISQERICKIWVNECFQKNQAMYMIRSQEQMVISIIDIFLKLLKSGQLQEELILDLRQEKPTIMRITHVIWKFSYEKRILIPPFFQFQQNSQNVLRKGNLHQRTYSNASQYQREGSIEVKQNFHSKFVDFDRKTSRSKQKSVRQNTSSAINFKESNTFRLNKSSQSYGVTFQKGSLSSKMHYSNKSDFISRQEQQNQISNCSTNNSTKPSSNQIYKSNKASIYKLEYKQDEETSKMKAELNKERMKNMIKQKIMTNLQKKKIVKFQPINTIKSIGEFTQSQKRLNEDSNLTINGGGLQILSYMGRKIENSYFQLELPSEIYTTSLQSSQQ